MEDGANARRNLGGKQNAGRGGRAQVAGHVVETIRSYYERRAAGGGTPRAHRQGNLWIARDCSVYPAERGTAEGEYQEAEKRGILILCTANMCRSPMAAAFLSRRLGGLGVPVPVRSAGTLIDGASPPAAVIDVMAGYGLDLGTHCSRIVTAADLGDADLVLGMAREHVRHAVVTLPATWPRAFTLKEFVRRAGQAGPRQAGEPFAAWVARLHAGRDRTTLLGESAADDVVDPVDGPVPGYAATAALLDDLLARLTELCWGRADARP